MNFHDYGVADFELQILGKYKASSLYIDDEENRAYEFDDRIAYFNPVQDRKSGGTNYVREFFAIR